MGFHQTIELLYNEANSQELRDDLQIGENIAGFTSDKGLIIRIYNEHK